MWSVEENCEGVRAEREEGFIGASVARATLWFRPEGLSIGNGRTGRAGASVEELKGEAFFGALRSRVKSVGLRAESL